MINVPPLCVGVIGIGQIALRGHLPGYVKAGATITALCSKPGAKLKQACEQYGIGRSYDDWRGMLDAGGFDAVSICTPPSLHAEMAIECARRGLHVLVEKPMALTVDECDAMIAAASQSGVLLMVGHNQRFIAHHQHVKHILDSGHLGRAYLAHAVFGHGGPEHWSPDQNWYFQPALAGAGVLADLGSHKIDLLCWLLGQKLVEVSALGATFEKATSACDTVACLLYFDKGTLATLHVSWVYRPGWENSLVIQCERGVIYIPTESSEPVRVVEQGEDGSPQIFSYAADTDDRSGWFGSVAAFVQAVTQGEPSPVSGEEGREVMRAVLAAQDAMAHTSVVKLASLS